MTENKPMANENAKNYGWVWWLVGGCLLLILIGGGLGLFLIWRAASGFVQNAQDLTEEFNSSFSDEIQNYELMNDDSNANDFDYQIEELDDWYNSDEYKKAMEDLEEINRLMEAGDWEAIEKMGQDLDESGDK